MMAAALPIIDLAFRHGHFTFIDAKATATYFFCVHDFAGTVVGAGAVCARLLRRRRHADADDRQHHHRCGFAADLSQPVPSLRRDRAWSIASDIGILMHTVVLAWLLHHKKMVLLSELPWLELMKALAIAVAAAFACLAVGRMMTVRASLTGDVISLGAISVAWLAVVALGLWITKSNLLRELRRIKSRAQGSTAPSGVEP